ncbi:MAG: transglutaminase-like domain-containing protein [Stellaceae bacterium]
MPIRRYLRTVLIALPFASALGIFADWQHDNALLRQQAVKITTNLNTDSGRIRAINDWVYQNKGFAKNNHYFIVPALGPTPVQVLEFGGDCSDKSRLVAAMLKELNVGAGLVMLSPCPNCGFIHTVVEAQYERGRMVVDPIWHVDYPTGDGEFLGVGDLAGTSRGRERVAELQRERGPSDKIAGMPATEATFDYAVAMNWDKNMATRAVAGALHLLGYTPEQMFRPRFIEDPKLALSLFLVCSGIAIIGANFVIYFVVQKVAGRRIRGPGETVPPASLQEAKFN